jgi:hypothetical protein
MRMDVEADLLQLMCKYHSVPQEVADLVINEEKPWYGFNRRHGNNRGSLHRSIVFAVPVEKAG